MPGKILIMTLGNTPEILSRNIKSGYYKNIIIILSEESEENINNEIKQEAKKRKVKLEYELINDPDDLEITFKKADEIIKSLTKKGINIEDIEINYTGGTKSMSAAICVAGVINGIRKQIYISGVRGEDSRVITGFEREVPTFSPLIMLSKSFNIIKLLFNDGDFYSAKKYIEYTEKDLGIKRNSDKFLNFLYEISDAYLSWDMMDYETAADKITKIRINLDDIERHLKVNFEEQLGRNKKIINLIKKSKFLRILDKYASAERYFEKGFYLLTVEMLYSLAEFIADYVLEKEYNLNKQNIDEKKVKEILTDKKIDISEDYFDTSRSKTDGIIHLPLYHSYDLLSKLGNELGKKFMEDKEYQNAIKSRNDLIHSNKTVDKEKAEKFLNVSKKFLEVFCKKYSDTKVKELDEIIKDYRFIKL